MAVGKDFEVSSRVVMGIAVPMTLAFLTTPILGITDLAVVGRLNDAALIGGLAAGAIVFDVVFSAMNFLRSGTTGLVAQAIGRGDEREEWLVLLRALFVAVACGLVVLASAPLLASAGAGFMAAGQGVTGAMTDYINIRSVGGVFALCNYAFLGYFLGRGEGRTGLVLQFVLNGTNIALSIGLGLGLGWGLHGVAWATVAAEAVASALALLIILKRGVPARAPSIAEIADRQALTKTFSVNRDIMIRSLVLLAAFAVFTQQGARLDTVTLAANAVLLNFFMIAGYFLDGFATAAEQLVGRAIGAGRRVRFVQAVKLTLLWGLALSAALSAATLLFGHLLITVITTEQNVIESAVAHLAWAAPCALTGVVAFQMDGIYIGATWSAAMRNMMLLSFLIYLLALSWLVPWLGNPGLWAALHVFLLARGISLSAALPHQTRRSFPESEFADRFEAIDR